MSHFSMHHLQLTRLSFETLARCDINSPNLLYNYMPRQRIGKQCSAVDLIMTKNFGAPQLAMLADCLGMPTTAVIPSWI